MKRLPGTVMHWLKHYWPGLLVLVIGLLMTLIISLWLAKEARTHDRARFENEVQLVINHIESRIEYSVQALGALRDRMSMHSAPDEGVWGVSIDTMKPWINYNGLVEIGFAEFVVLKTDQPFSNENERLKALHAERLKAIAQRREHFGDRFTSNTNLCVNPEVYVPVKFHCFNPPSPSGVYRDYGRDLAGEESVYEAISDVDDNREAASRRISLDDATNAPAAGFMVVLPVYDPNLSISLSEITSFRAQPRPGRLDELYFRACRGVVFGSFDLRGIVKSTLGGFKPTVDFVVFDRAGLHATNLLYGAFDAFVSRAAQKPYFSTHRELPNYGQRLHFYFHTMPVFEAASHRYRPWLALATGLLLSGAFTGITFTQVRGRLKEAAISRELRASRDQLELAMRERERLSRDLHDGTIQSIYAVGLGLQHCRKVLTSDPPRAPELLAHSVEELNGIIRELREFILTLEPELLRGQTIGSVLTAFVARISKTTDTKILLQVDAEACEQVHPQHAVQILNLVREGVSNSLKHAQPSRIDIDLQVRNNCIRLAITDDGVGFDVSQPGGLGYGLANMRLRAEHLRGRLDLHSTQGTGTRIVVTIPFQYADACANAN